MEMDIINDRIPLAPMSPDVFDRFMEKGWRILGYIILRHNAVVYNDDVAFTIPLRVVMDGFQMSKSQRKLFRANNKRFTHYVKPISITEEKNNLFLKHCTRFRYGNHYDHVSTFITNESWYNPVPGYEIELYHEGKLIACSYFHLGNDAFCGTYCFFDPDYESSSLGNYTMLLELETARQMGKKYYYSGYIHHTPSQFDYKLNFNNLERFDWMTETWSSQERVPPARQVAQD